jgi:UDP-N-acetylglucosamine--N-acetylmuramyl-(pentapeptide) pyrophosphoryl-undecaprenol N-acetylglucosamine transferase
MRAADLVICRSGATTLAELTAAGRPAILVPLPNSTDDHQRRNAEVFAATGAAVVIEERELPATLADALRALVGDAERRRAMSRAARTMAKADAAERIADRAEQLVRDAR